MNQGMMRRWRTRRSRAFLGLVEGLEPRAAAGVVLPGAMTEGRGVGGPSGPTTAGGDSWRSPLRPGKPGAADREASQPATWSRAVAVPAEAAGRGPRPPTTRSDPGSSPRGEGDVITFTIAPAATGSGSGSAGGAQPPRGSQPIQATPTASAPAAAAHGGSTEDAPLVATSPPSQGQGPPAAAGTPTAVRARASGTPVAAAAARGLGAARVDSRQALTAHLSKLPAVGGFQPGMPGASPSTAVALGAQGRAVNELSGRRSPLAAAAALGSPTAPGLPALDQLIAATRSHALSPGATPEAARPVGPTAGPGAAASAVRPSLDGAGLLSSSRLSGNLTLDVSMAADPSAPAAGPSLLSRYATGPGSTLALPAPAGAPKTASTAAGVAVHTAFAPVAVATPPAGIDRPPVADEFQGTIGGYSTGAGDSLLIAAGDVLNIAGGVASFGPPTAPTAPNKPSGATPSPVGGGDGGTCCWDYSYTTHQEGGDANSHWSADWSVTEHECYCVNSQGNITWDSSYTSDYHYQATSTNDWQYGGTTGHSESKDDTTSHRDSSGHGNWNVDGSGASEGDSSGTDASTHHDESDSKTVATDSLSSSQTTDDSTGGGKFSNHSEGTWDGHGTGSSSGHSDSTNDRSTTTDTTSHDAYTPSGSSHVVDTTGHGATTHHDTHHDESQSSSTPTSSSGSSSATNDSKDHQDSTGHTGIEDSQTTDASKTTLSSTDDTTGSEDDAHHDESTGTSGSGGGAVGGGGSGGGGGVGAFGGPGAGGNGGTSSSTNDRVGKRSDTYHRHDTDQEDLADGTSAEDDTLDTLTHDNTKHHDEAKSHWGDAGSGGDSKSADDPDGDSKSTYHETGRESHAQGGNGSNQSYTFDSLANGTYARHDDSKATWGNEGNASSHNFTRDKHTDETADYAGGKAGHQAVAGGTEGSNGSATDHSEDSHTRSEVGSDDSTGASTDTTHDDDGDSETLHVVGTGTDALNGGTDAQTVDQTLTNQEKYHGDDTDGALSFTLDSGGTYGGTQVGSGGGGSAATDAYTINNASAENSTFHDAGSRPVNGPVTYAYTAGAGGSDSVSWGDKGTDPTPAEGDTGGSTKFGMGQTDSDTFSYTGSGSPASSTGTVTVGGKDASDLGETGHQDSASGGDTQADDTGLTIHSDDSYGYKATATRNADGTRGLNYTVDDSGKDNSETTVGGDGTRVEPGLDGTFHDTTDQTSGDTWGYHFGADANPDGSSDSNYIADDHGTDGSTIDARGSNTLDDGSLGAGHDTFHIAVGSADDFTVHGDGASASGSTPTDSFKVHVTGTDTASLSDDGGDARSDPDGTSEDAYGVVESEPQSYEVTVTGGGGSSSSTVDSTDDPTWKIHDVGDANQADGTAKDGDGYTLDESTADVVTYHSTGGSTPSGPLPTAYTVDHTSTTGEALTDDGTDSLGQTGDVTGDAYHATETADETSVYHAGGVGDGYGSGTYTYTLSDNGHDNTLLHGTGSDALAQYGEGDTDGYTLDQSHGDTYSLGTSGGTGSAGTFTLDASGDDGTTLADAGGVTEDPADGSTFNLTQGDHDHYVVHNTGTEATTNLSLDVTGDVGIGLNSSGSSAGPDSFTLADSANATYAAHEGNAGGSLSGSGTDTNSVVEGNGLNNAEAAPIVLAALAPDPQDDRKPLPAVPGAGAGVDLKAKPIQATAKVTPEVAAKILGNVTQGQAPWKPAEGRVGGVAFFTSEGNPYTGTNANATVSINVEIANFKDALVFNTQKLDAIFEGFMKEIIDAKTKEFAARLNGQQPSANKVADWRNSAKRFVESKMWNEVGRQVAESPNGLGEVILKGSQFSKTGDGKFAVVADKARANITLKGGPAPLIEALKAAENARVEPAVEAAAIKAAKTYKAAATVRGVFRVGGRVLLVLGLANDVIEVVYAQDKVKTFTKKVGGWTGALAAGSAFGVFFTPADVAGPIAWGIHGLGTLAAGGIGYWAGSTLTEKLYEVIIEGK